MPKLLCGKEPEKINLWLLLCIITFMMCRYDVVPLTEELLLQEQQKAEDMLQAFTAGTALSPAPSGPLLNDVPADSGKSSLTSNFCSPVSMFASMLCTWLPHAEHARQC